MEASKYLGKLGGAVMLMSALGFAPQQAGAAVVLSGCAGGSFGADCGLDELIAGGSIQIDGTLFSNFSLSLFNGRLADASAIRVDAVDVKYNPGFSLVDVGNTLLATAGDLTQNDFTFDVTRVAGSLFIKDNSLVVGVGDVSNDGSFINVFEAVLTTDFVNLLGNKDVFCDGPACANQDGTDLAVFGKVAGVSIVGGIDAVSTSGVAEINSITMQFSQVPEPGSLALLALGIGGLAFSTRRRKASA